MLQELILGSYGFEEIGQKAIDRSQMTVAVNVIPLELLEQYMQA